MVKANKTICAIIPSFNEAKTMARMLNDLIKISFLDQIIVINDGSTDGTQSILNNFVRYKNIVVITNDANLGKGASVAKGLEVSKSDLVLLLDADIVNYTGHDLLKLIEPVINKRYDYTLKPTDDIILKRLSGIRCYWRSDLMPIIPKMKQTSRYGLEILLNRHFINKNSGFIVLNDYHHYQKWEKYSLPKAVWEYFKEGASLIKQLLILN